MLPTFSTNPIIPNIDCLYWKQSTAYGFHSPDCTSYFSWSTLFCIHYFIRYSFNLWSRVIVFECMFNIILLTDWLIDCLIWLIFLDHSSMIGSVTWTFREAYCAEENISCIICIIKMFLLYKKNSSLNQPRRLRLDCSSMFPLLSLAQIASHYCKTMKDYNSALCLFTLYRPNHHCCQQYSLCY